MKKMKKVMKQLVKLMARQVEQQDSILLELKRHNELMAKSLALNQQAMRLEAAPERPTAKPKALPAAKPVGSPKPEATPKAAPRPASKPKADPKPKPAPKKP